MQIYNGASYVIKPKTMVMDKVDQLVQVENHVDFIALKRQGVDIGSYLLYQGIYDYFGILNGPSYAELVKDI